MRVFYRNRILPFEIRSFEREMFTENCSQNRNISEFFIKEYLTVFIKSSDYKKSHISKYKIFY